MTLAARSIAEARAAWPQLDDVSDEELGAHLTRHGAGATGGRAADLLLAPRCARGLPAAPQAFLTPLLPAGPPPPAPPRPAPSPPPSPHGRPGGRGKPPLRPGG